MNDKPTDESSDWMDGSELTWWDTRLHQLFSLVALAYLGATWVAPTGIAPSLAVLLYAVVIPILILFYAIVDTSGSNAPVPVTIIGATLLAASLTWGVFRFVANNVYWAEILPIALLLLSFGLLSWNSLDS